MGRRGRKKVVVVMEINTREVGRLDGETERKGRRKTHASKLSPGPGVGEAEEDLCLPTVTHKLI